MFKMFIVFKYFIEAEQFVRAHFTFGLPERYSNGNLHADLKQETRVTCRGDGEEDGQKYMGTRIPIC